MMLSVLVLSDQRILVKHILHPSHLDRSSKMDCAGAGRTNVKKRIERGGIIYFDAKEYVFCLHECIG